MAAGTFLPWSKIAKNPHGRQKIADPQTLGGHLLNRRIGLGLLQREVSAILAVSEDTVTYWENGRAHPQVHCYPAIISFLGYYPFGHETESPSGMLEKARRCNGWTYRQLGNALGVDASTARRWVATLCLASKKNTQNAGILVRQFLAKQSLSI
jgi:DNA-binding XRE family transcriptional regulator